MTIAQLVDGREADLTLLDVFPDWLETSACGTFKDISIRSKPVELTPEVASVLLRTQLHNRKPSNQTISGYVRRIKSGDWGFSQPLIWDDRYHLIDGQHRLSAIAKAGQPITCLIISGYPQGSQHVFDVGLKRTVGSIAQLQGFTSFGSGKASTIRAMFSNVSSIRIGDRSYMCTEALGDASFVIRFYEHNQEAVDFAYSGFWDLVPGEKQSDTTIRTSIINGLIALAYPHENHEQLARFACGFANGAIVEPNSVLRFRNEYIKRRSIFSQGGNGRSLREEMFRLAANALIKFLKGEHVRRLDTIGTLPAKWVPIIPCVDGQAVVVNSKSA